jgi:hypothetical protein
MNPIPYTPDLISMVVGAVISLLFNYFPGLNTWFSALRTEVKSFIMIGLLAVASVAIYLLSLYGIVEISQPVDWVLVLRTFILAVVANQSAYVIAPQTSAVKAAKQ